MQIKFFLLFFIISISFCFGATQETQSLYYKEKQELLEVKDELNEFYETKEVEYQKNKAELEKIHQEIKKSETAIQKIKEENQKVLQEIKREITSKSMTMYDKMKLSVVINVFNEMINNGEIDEVFDIMIRMPDKRVMKIMKKLDTKTTTLLMKKMRILKDEKKQSN
jgi:hypothetical protein